MLPFPVIGSLYKGGCGEWFPAPAENQTYYSAASALSAVLAAPP